MNNLILTKKKDYLIVQLNQGKVNALNTDLIADIRQVIKESREDDTIRGLILTGHQGVFSAGLDLVQIFAYDREQLEVFLGQFENMYKEMAHFSKPMVCAISGHSPAGGCVMAITADHRIMAAGDKYTIGLNEVAVNINISPEIVAGYTFWIGHGQAHKYLLDGKLLSVQEAFDCGLVDEVCPMEELLPRAEAKMEQYLKADDEVFINTKAIARTPWLAVFKGLDKAARAKQFSDHWWKPESRARMQRILNSLSARKKNKRKMDLSHLSAINKKDFLTKETPQILQKLTKDQDPAFGLMTAQHMVEHLTWVIKSSAKRSGEPDPALAEKQMGFKKFIERGSVLQHRPSDKTKADLPSLKYASIEEALTQIPVAVDRFYTQFEGNPDFKAYNPFMGELSFEEIELFHFMHVRYHLWQFGLLPSYP